MSTNIEESPQIFALLPFKDPWEGGIKVSTFLLRFIQNIFSLSKLKMNSQQCI